MLKIAVLLTGDEPKALKDAVIESSKLDGDMVEIGVYQGGSAKIIIENWVWLKCPYCDSENVTVSKNVTPQKPIIIKK